MLEDSDRLLHTIEQVLRAGAARDRGCAAAVARARLDLGARARVRRAGADAVPPRRRVARATSSTSTTPTPSCPRRRRRAEGGRVWNLIDNAVKYSPQGRQGPRRARGDRRHGWRSACGDHGVGISPAELKRIFRRFYRIPASVAMRVKGSGLGLFIVRSVARKHGGRAFARERRRRAGQHLHAAAAGGRRPRA